MRLNQSLASCSASGSQVHPNRIQWFLASLDGQQPVSFQWVSCWQERQGSGFFGVCIELGWVGLGEKGLDLLGVRD